MRFNVRYLIRRDVPEVMDIERLSFEEKWDHDELARCVKERNIMACVIEHGESVIGWSRS